MIDKHSTADLIGKLISSYGYHFCNEKDLQDALEEVFRAGGVEYRREVSLTKADRIDFMIGSVGLEVKVGSSYADVVRQLHRYANLAGISELVLVTNRLSHTMPAELNGKRLHTINLGLSTSL